MRRASSVVLLFLAALLSACGGGEAAGTRIVQLEIAPAGAAVAAGRSQQFTAVAVYDDGSEEDVTRSVAWSSSLPAVATIDASGMAKSHDQGSVEIVADLAKVTRKAPLTVTAPVAERIRVEPGDRAVSSNDRVAYAAYATFSDGTERNVTGAARWSSTDLAVATMTEDSDPFADPGDVTARGDGVAEIVAAYGGVQGRTPITVVPSVIYGGGDMLTALAYVGSSWFNRADPAASRRLSNHHNPPDAGSVFGSLGSDPLVAYCQAGEDIGKFVYAGDSGARPDDACGDYRGQPQGFSGIRAAPDFAGAELPLAQQEYTRAKEARGSDPVQIPAFAASIAISYNNPEVTGNLNLTTDQLRGIITGAIATWDQISPDLSPQRIVVVYRSDYSAATFALANHLSCIPTPTVLGVGPDSPPRRPCSGFVSNSGDVINTSPWFTEVTGTMPLDWIAAGSNAASGALVLSTPFSIGYGEAADLALRFPNLRLADVNGFGPLVLPKSPLIRVFTDECVLSGFGPREIPNPSGSGRSPRCGTSGVGDTTGTFGPGRPVVRHPDQEANPCVVLVDPDTYASPSTASATHEAPPPPDIYPILSISYLLAYTASDDNAAPAIRKLLLAPYSGKPLPPGFVTLAGYAPVQEQIENCVE